MYYKFLLTAGLSLLLLPLSAVTKAQDGLYLGTDLGLSAAQAMDVWGSANDVATACDEYFIVRTPETRGCDAPPSSWVNAIDGETGFAAGLRLGYRAGRWRYEAEYLFSSIGYDDVTPVRVRDQVLGNKLDQEIELAVAGVADYAHHAVFGNLYYEFGSSSNFVPYLGVGAGMALVSMDYFQTWKRNDDPRYITTFPNNPDGSISDLNRRLSGTTTVGDDELTDTLFGYQLTGGVNYRINDNISLDLRLRRELVRRVSRQRRVSPVAQP